MKVVINIPKPASKTWKVKGDTIRKVFANLNKHKWWGRYRSNPDHKKKKGKDKNIEQVTVTGKPVITMPVWTNYSKMSKEAKKSWDDMWKALQKHEDHHHTIFEEQAKIWKDLMEAKDSVDEKTLKTEWKKFHKTHQAAQDKYDKRTDHGKKEGVILQDVP